MTETDATEPFSCDSPEAWAAAGARLKRRRLDLGMTITEVAEAGNTSAVSVSDLEEGRRTSYRALTLARVASGVGWSSSAIPNMLAGGDPEPLTMPAVFAETRLESVEERLRSLDERLGPVEAKLDEILDRLPSPGGGP